MEPAAPAIVALTLGIYMHISRLFSAGVKGMEENDYIRADNAFSDVVKTTVEPNPLLEPALYWRAQCRLKLQQREAALQDLVTLLNRSPGGPLAAMAAANFKSVTEREWEGLLLTTPEETWKSIVSVINRNDLKALDRCVTGKSRAEMQELLEDKEALDVMRGLIGGMKLLRVEYSPDRTLARLAFSAPEHDAFGPGDAEQEGAIMERTAQGWLMLDDDGPDYAARFAAPAPAPDAAAPQVARWQEDEQKLRRLGEALLQVVAIRGAPPARLRDLETLVADFAKLSVSSTCDAPFGFAVPTDNTPPWIFAPAPLGGWRLGFVEGTLQKLPEARFRELAAQVGVSLPADAGPAGTAPAPEAVRKLIAQLGASSFAERKSAYDLLKAHGSAIRPLLESAARDRDPEIAVQVRQLLAEL